MKKNNRFIANRFSKGHSGHVRGNVLIRMPEELREKLDRLASDFNMTRTEVIIRLLSRDAAANLVADVLEEARIKRELEQKRNAGKVINYNDAKRQRQNKRATG